MSNELPPQPGTRLIGVDVRSLRSSPPTTTPSHSESRLVFMRHRKYSFVDAPRAAAHDGWPLLASSRRQPHPQE